MFCSFPSILCSPTHTHTHTQIITMFRRMYTCRGVCVCESALAYTRASTVRFMPLLSAAASAVIWPCFQLLSPLLAFVVIVIVTGSTCVSLCLNLHFRFFYAFRLLALLAVWKYRKATHTHKHTMSARTSSGSTAAVQSTASSSTAYVPRPPPRRRAASVAGQQPQQRLDYRNGHAPRRSLAAVVSPSPVTHIHAYIHMYIHIS